MNWLKKNKHYFAFLGVCLLPAYVFDDRVLIERHFTPDIPELSLRTIALYVFGFLARQFLTRAKDYAREYDRKNPGA